jgi:hypothetical protein
MTSIIKGMMKPDSGDELAEEDAAGVLESWATPGVPGPLTALGGRFWARSKSLERRGDDMQLLIGRGPRDPDAVG